MAKRQLTLGSFGFTKSVSHRGKVTEVNIPTTASQDFEAKKGLVIHVKCTHPTAEASESSSKKQKTDSNNPECVEAIVKHSLNTLITNVEREIQASKEKHARIGRRGKDRRENTRLLKSQM